ncbi:MAG TPA: choline/ethanolamine kinase family protein [Chitinophagaceae bacterium]|nr:choline/ethanolamine kinase family protein [Chitinophagaceae bacterium]
MVPENKQPVVRKALRAAFGVDQYEAMEPLEKGLSSALVYRIRVGGKSYVLRVITRTDAQADPTYYFSCMAKAAEAGIAPPIRYLDREDRVSITDFVEGRPFGAGEALTGMPRLLRRLHTLPNFPFRIDYLEKMEGFMQSLRKARLLPEQALHPLYEAYDRVARVYPRMEPASLVSCHNDLKPENILFDGTRPWLVDWEGAFLNDRYLDLAVVANFVVREETQEDDFLAAYFGRPATEQERARLFLMAQLLHLHYFTLFLLVGSGHKPVDLYQEAPPAFREFHDRMWEGQIDLSRRETQLHYALVHRGEFLRKAGTARLEASLRLLAQSSRSA